MHNVVIFYNNSNLVTASVPAAKYDVLEYNHIILSYRLSFNQNRTLLLDPLGGKSIWLLIC